MNTKSILAISLFLFTVSFLSCGQDSETNTESNQDTYEDPFAYCKSIGDIDTPGSDYTGPKVPDSITSALRKDIGVSQDMPDDLFVDGTFWRCMDGNVYACNAGANIPCQERANMSKIPNHGMLNYCGENPDAEFIPMFASGRTTVYEWKCDNGTPEIVKQIAETDKAGYIKGIWYKISP